MTKQVDIKVKTVVDTGDLDGLKKKLTSMGEEEPTIKVKADTSEAEADLKNTRKIIANETRKGNDITVTYQVEGDDKVYKSIGWAKRRLAELEDKDAKIKIDADDKASKDIDNIKKKADDLDGSSPKVKPEVDDNATDELDNVQKKADDLDGQSPKIKPTVDDGEALGALQNIQNAMDNLGGMETAVSGLLAGMGVEKLLGGGLETAQGLDKSWRGWVGSLQHSGKSLEQAKTRADQLYGTINNLASTGQSNDQFFKNIAGIVVKTNTNVSDSTLKMTEEVISGYELMRGASGDTIYEMEKEISQFLSTGETSRLTELESLGGGKWMPLLKGADTAEERLKVLRQLLEEEGIMGALNVDSPTKSIDQMIATLEASMTSMGTTIIHAVKPIVDAFLWLDDITNGVSTGIISITAVAGLLGVAFLGVASMIMPAVGSLKDFIKTARGVNKVTDSLGNMADNTGLTQHTAQMTRNTTAIRTNTIALQQNNIARNRAGKGAAVSSAAMSGGSVATGLPTQMNQMGAVGNSASKAAPGVAKGSAGLNIMSMSLTQMIVPILKISAVLAIIIPIVAGLAAMIIIFVRGLAELVKWLGFDKLNLKPAIEGIKQVGVAFFEIGKAFGALVLVNVVGLVYNATGGILGTAVALGQFWLAMKGVEAVLKDINKLDINQSTVTKINNLKMVLAGMSTAMLGMAGLNIAGVMTWLTGGVAAIKANIKNISEIGKAIQEMNIPSVDSSKVESIKKLSEVIKSLSEASQAVDNATGWFNEKVLNIADVEGIQATLRNLGYIATNINDATIPEVNQDKVGLVKKLAEVIKPLADAGKAVDDATGDFNTNVLNIDDVEGMAATLRNLGYIATNINATTIPPVSKDKIDAVRNIENVITPLVNSSKLISDNWQSIVVTPAMAVPFTLAINALYSINQAINSKAFSVDTSKVEAINQLKTVISSIGSIGLFISQNTKNIGTHISDNADDIKGAINGLYSINQSINSKPFLMDPAKIEAMTQLKTAIIRIGEISSSISTNIASFQGLSDNAAAVNGAIQALYSINQQINSMPFQVDEAKTAAINSLNTLIQTIVNTLKTASGIQPAAQSMGTQIVTGFKAGAKNLGPSTVIIVGAAITAVQNRYDTMRSAGNALGAALASGFKSGAGINSPMAIVVSGMSETLKHITSLTGKFYSAGEAIGSAVQDSYRAQHKSTTEAGYSKLINEVRGDVVNLFNGSGFSWMGGSASAAGGGVSPISAAGGDFDIEYPSSSPPNITINSAVVSQDQIDQIGELYQKWKAQDNLRVKL